MEDSEDGHYRERPEPGFASNDLRRLYLVLFADGSHVHRAELWRPEPGSVRHRSSVSLRATVRVEDAAIFAAQLEAQIGL